MASVWMNTAMMADPHGEGDEYDGSCGQASFGKAETEGGSQHPNPRAEERVSVDPDFLNVSTDDVKVRCIG